MQLRLSNSYKCQTSAVQNSDSTLLNILPIGFGTFVKAAIDR